MKTLEQEKVDLAAVIEHAKKEPVLLLTSDGRELMVTEADDFEREVEMLRNSASFQKFLDERSASPGRIPLATVRKKIERELAKERRDATRKRKRTRSRA